MSMATDTGSSSSGFSSKGITTGIGNLGGAVSDLFAYEGTQATEASDKLAASSYTAAAGIATDNLSIEQQSVAIKQQQADRAIFQNESSQQATAAANGFEEAGSAASILADSANQGSLQKSLIDQQGQITENATKIQINTLDTQAAQATAAANAAGTAGIGDLVGGAFKTIAGVASLALP